MLITSLIFAAYLLIAMIFLVNFTRYYPNTPTPLLIITSLLFIVTVPYAYVKSVLRAYQENTNNE
jgi:hypothetical protein